MYQMAYFFIRLNCSSDYWLCIIAIIVDIISLIHTLFIDYFRKFYF